MPKPPSTTADGSPLVMTSETPTSAATTLASWMRSGRSPSRAHLNSSVMSGDVATTSAACSGRMCSSAATDRRLKPAKPSVPSAAIFTIRPSKASERRPSNAASSPRKIAVAAR